MANSYEKNINEMVSDLNALKESAIDANACDLNKSQINVQSIGSDEVVIQLNLNKKVGIVSSSGDEENDQRSHNNNNDKSKSKSTKNGESQSSANDFQEVTEDKSNKSTKTRTSRRTISESTNEDSTKGILKYSYSWNRRTVSESHCDSIDPDLDLLSMFWHSVEDFYSDDDLYYEKKHKKNVRFSENVSKTVFRPNSSILGRKLKNKKRAKNRKNNINNNNNNPKTETNSNEFENKANSSDCERIRQDSGYDSEDNALHMQNKDSLEAHHKNIDFTIETGIENLNFN